MKKIVLLSIALAAVFSSCQNGGSKSSDAQIDSLSNAFGTLMGYSAKQIKGVELNMGKFNEGFAKEYNNKQTDMASVEAANAYVQNYMTNILPAKQLEAQKEYVAKLESNSNIKKTESGLMYEIISEGDVNAKPMAIDTVEVHYTGTLTDGSKFDSSLDRNEPAKFPLNGVIKGWTEGLQLIGKGGKIKLYIPSELAYGNQGQLANQLLVFDVELLSISKGVEEAK